jgi:uncharacterized protein (DUF2336 family)
MGASASIIGELEAAVQSGSAEKRVDTLRRVTDLFLIEADRLNDAQIGVFDDVLLKLIARIETKAIAELSSRLAPVDNAPIEVIRRMARDDELAVAGPVLTTSSRLTAGDLIEIAETKSQGHLLAMSSRSQLAEEVTDVLLNRGSSEVANRLAANSGARFSEMGFQTLVKAGETDAVLAEKVGLRLDLPIRLLRELLLKATEAVRSRLLSRATPESRDEIRKVLESISCTVTQEAAAPRDYRKAQELVLSMQMKGQLNESAIMQFANANQYEETVVALSLLSGAHIDIIKPLMRAPRPDGLLFPCKSADLKWETVKAIVLNRITHHSMSDHDLAQCKSNFIALSKATAQRTLRFWAVRNSASTRPTTAASATT